MSKAQFKSAYNHPEGKVTPSGDQWETTYGYDDDGTLVKTGKENVYDKIQEGAEDCKIENLLKRAAAGDTAVFRPDGIYEDVSNIPKDFNSQQEFINRSIENAVEEAQENEQEHRTTLQQHTEDRSETVEVRHEQQPQNNV